MSFDGKEEKRLILICEGGAHTVEYFHRNRVFPGAVVLTSTKFREMFPYLSRNDEVLVLIKGMTDFSMVEVYALLNDLDEAEEKLSDITVLSNVDLGAVTIPYYLYQGDLFYGRIHQVENGKKTEVVRETQAKAKQNKRKRKGKTATIEPVEELQPNLIMEQYKEYSRSSTKLLIYGDEIRKEEPTHAENLLVQEIVTVNLFPETE